MKTKLFLLTIFALPLITIAQEEKSEKKFRDNIAVSFDPTAGGQFIDLSELNSSLNQIGFSNFSNGNSNLGINVGFWFYERAFIGTEWSFVSNFKNPTSSNNQTAYLDGSRLLIIVGYNFFRAEKINLSGYIGYGGNLSTLTIKDNSGFNTFNSAITSRNTSTTDLISELIEFTVGADYLLKPKNMDCEKRKLRIGIRAGYQYGISNRWSSGTDEIQGPKIINNGLVFKVIFGQLQN